MKKNIIIFLILSAVFFLVYLLITLDKEERIAEVLHDESKYLELSYNQGLDRFHVIGENVYASLQNDGAFVDIIADTAKNGIDKTHDALYMHIKDEFMRLEQLGVMGLQVVLPNNVSILRMHKTDKYGDDLTPVRFSLDYVNKHKTHLHGFEEGRTSHAFRELYPIFKDGRHLGVMEILFSSTRLQDYTMRASNIHTHFLVNKNVFEVNAWQSNLVEPYKQSIEHPDYLFSLNDHMQMPRLDSSKKVLIEPLRAEIDAGFATHKAFEVYKKVANEIRVVAFMPVHRMKDNKVVAYLVSYTTSTKIGEIIERYKVLLIALGVIFVLLSFLILLIIKDKNRMLDELQYDLLTGLLNRKYFMTLAAEMIKNSNREKDVYSMVMADIDFFKQVNDTYGHQCGDTVLIEFAKILKESVRSQDKVARYGGEEFILLIVTDKENAYKVVETIRKKVDSSVFGQKHIKLSASFGVSQVRKGEALESTIKRADEALYKAKEAGRNQTQTL